MTDQDELKSILGDDTDKRNRPFVNVRRRDKRLKNKGNRKGATTTHETEQVGEVTVTTFDDRVEVTGPIEVLSKEPLFQALHAETNTTKAVDVESTVIEPIKENEMITETKTLIAEAEALVTEADTLIAKANGKVAAEWKWPELKDVFGTIPTTNTWTQIALAAIDSVRFGRHNLASTFRGLDRLKDSERDAELRVYNFIDLARHLGKHMFAATVEIEEGYTRLSIGSRNDYCELTIKEKDDQITMFYDFNPKAGIGLLMAEKFAPGEVFGIERLDDAIIALDVARTASYAIFFSSSEVIDMIRKEDEAMAK